MVQAAIQNLSKTHFIGRRRLNSLVTRHQVSHGEITDSDELTTDPD